MKRLPLQAVSGVPRQHAHFLHALPHGEVLYRGGVRAHLGFESFHEAPESLFAQNVACAAAHVALLGVGFEPPAVIDGLVGRVVREKPPEVVHDDIRVVICFEEPVSLVDVMLVGVVEGPDGFPVKLVPTFFRTQAHRGEVGVLHGAHENHYITVARPRVFDVPCLGLQVAGACHHPAKNTHLFVQLVGHVAIFTYNREAGIISSLRGAQTLSDSLWVCLCKQGILQQSVCCDLLSK